VLNPTCSKSCGTDEKKDRGTMTMTRTILGVAKYGGEACPTADCFGENCLSKYYPGGCFVELCPIHCIVGEWKDWGSCTGTGQTDHQGKVCGTGGTRTRRRKILERDDHGGSVCPETKNGSCPAAGAGSWCTDTDTCVVGQNNFVGACPIDCVASEWGSWHAFSGGLNQVERKRTIITEAQHNGKTSACEPLRQTKKWTVVKGCTEKEEYGTWSDCTKDCGTGYRYRYKEHVMCSKQAVVRMHYMFRQGEHCNVGVCADDAAAAVVHDITIPTIASSMFLDEQLAGNWESVDAAKMGLPNGHWQKLA
jgi:hypothetical protein